MGSPSATIANPPGPDGCDCPICFGCYVEPLTLPCSHSFCRLCLLQSTRLSPDGRSCPLCRSPITVRDLVTHGASPEIEDAVRSSVPPDEYEARRSVHATELAEFLARRESELPVFFMRQAIAPGADVRLHLFEPRYKILIRRTWEGNREFVYCAGVPSAGATGVVVRVRRARFLPEGRCNIQGVGVRSVTLGETWVEDGTFGLYYTRVERRPDGAPPSDPPEQEERAPRPRARWFSLLRRPFRPS